MCIYNLYNLLHTSLRGSTQKTLHNKISHCYVKTTLNCLCERYNFEVVMLVHFQVRPYFSVSLCIHRRQNNICPNTVHVFWWSSMWCRWWAQQQKSNYHTIGQCFHWHFPLECNVLFPLLSCFTVFLLMHTDTLSYHTVNWNTYPGFCPSPLKTVLTLCKLNLSIHLLFLFRLSAMSWNAPQWT